MAGFLLDLADHLCERKETKIVYEKGKAPVKEATQSAGADRNFYEKTSGIIV